MCSRAPVKLERKVPSATALAAKKVLAGSDEPAPLGRVNSPLVAHPALLDFQAKCDWRRAKSEAQRRAAI